MGEGRGGGGGKKVGEGRGGVVWVWGREIWGGKVSRCMRFLVEES